MRVGTPPPAGTSPGGLPQREPHARGGERAGLPVIRTATAALSPERTEAGANVYRVARNVALAPTERADVKFWAEHAGTLERVALRWKAEGSDHAREESLNGKRVLKPGDVVELEIENRWARPTIVNVFCFVRS